jgi:Cu-processing system permease protein
MSMLPNIEFAPIRTMAAKEFRDRLRSRWVLAVAVVFAIFAMAIAYFGAAQQGAIGFRGLAYTIASLVSLVIYLIPLIALMLGFDAIVGERERGSLDLLLSMPITRSELLLGKFLGLAAALALPTLGGFGLVGGMIAWQGGWHSLFHYGGFMFSTLMLGLAFLSIAVLISVLAKDRTRASGTAIAAWFFLVLIYDLLLLGALVVTGGETGAALFPVLLLLNPADVYRLLNIFSLEDVKTIYGLATVFPDSLANPALLGSVMTAWIVVPLGMAAWRFNKT